MQSLSALGLGCSLASHLKVLLVGEVVSHILWAVSFWRASYVLTSLYLCIHQRMRPKTGYGVHKEILEEKLKACRTLPYSLGVRICLIILFRDTKQMMRMKGSFCSLGYMDVIGTGTFLLQTDKLII